MSRQTSIPADTADAFKFALTRDMPTMIGAGVLVLTFVLAVATFNPSFYRGLFASVAPDLVAPSLDEIWVPTAEEQQRVARMTLAAIEAAMARKSNAPEGSAAPGAAAAAGGRTDVSLLPPANRRTRDLLERVPTMVPEVGQRDVTTLIDDTKNGVLILALGGNNQWCAKRVDLWMVAGGGLPDPKALDVLAPRIALAAGKECGEAERVMLLVTSNTSRKVIASRVLPKSQWADPKQLTPDPFEKNRPPPSHIPFLPSGADGSLRAPTARPPSPQR